MWIKYPGNQSLHNLYLLYLNTNNNFQIYGSQVPIVSLFKCDLADALFAISLINGQLPLVTPMVRYLLHSTFPSLSQSRSRQSVNRQKLEDKSVLCAARSPELCLLELRLGRIRRWSSCTWDVLLFLLRLALRKATLPER